LIAKTYCCIVGGLPGQQKVALRLKQQTSKIVSSFKANVISCTLVKDFAGHKDGIWDVNAVAKLGVPVIGTASAGKIILNRIRMYSIQHIVSL